MNHVCPVCKQRMEPEPGFYQGAMFVSYAISTLVLIFTGIILYYMWDPSEWIYIGIVSSIILAMVPWNYRYSRILFLYAFGGIKFDPTFVR